MEFFHLPDGTEQCVLHLAVLTLQPFPPLAEGTDTLSFTELNPFSSWEKAWMILASRIPGTGTECL